MANSAIVSTPIHACITMTWSVQQLNVSLCVCVCVCVCLCMRMSVCWNINFAKIESGAQTYPKPTARFKQLWIPFAHSRSTVQCWKVALGFSTQPRETHATSDLVQLFCGDWQCRCCELHAWKRYWPSLPQTQPHLAPHRIGRVTWWSSTIRSQVGPGPRLPAFHASFTWRSAANCREHTSKFRCS